MTTKHFWRVDGYALNLGPERFFQFHMSTECLDYRRYWSHTRELSPNQALAGTVQGTPYDFTCPNCGHVSRTVYVPTSRGSLRGDDDLFRSLDQFQPRLSDSEPFPAGCSYLIFKLTSMTPKEENTYWNGLRVKTRPHLYSALAEQLKRKARAAGRD